MSSLEKALSCGGVRNPALRRRRCARQLSPLLKHPVDAYVPRESRRAASARLGLLTRVSGRGRLLQPLAVQSSNRRLARPLPAGAKNLMCCNWANASPVSPYSSSRWVRTQSLRQCRAAPPACSRCLLRGRPRHLSDFLKRWCCR